MLTCFIQNDFEQINQELAVYSILIIPLIFLIYAVYAFIKVFRIKKVKFNKDIQIKMVRYVIYSGLYILFYFPTIILYFVTINQTTFEKYTFNSWFAYLCTLFNIMINLFLSIFRICEGYVQFPKKLLLCFFINPNVYEDVEANLLNETTGVSLDETRINRKISNQLRSRGTTTLSFLHDDNIRDVLYFNLV
jgi:hypothetical protein